MVQTINANQNFPNQPRAGALGSLAECPPDIRLRARELIFH
jgi:hypothetical protein